VTASDDVNDGGCVPLFLAYSAALCPVRPVHPMLALGALGVDRLVNHRTNQLAVLLLVAVLYRAA
jgi:hypothetical protein